MNWPDDYINRVLCGDCLEVMKGIPDGAVDALISDPPYGIDLKLNSDRGVGRKRHKFAGTVIGDDRPFNPQPLLRFIDKPMLLFGANYFCKLLPDGGWIVWDKRVDLPSDDQSDGELIWHNMNKKVEIFRHRWRGYVKDGEETTKYHPTQKPIALMRWIINKWTNINDIILDPFAGSGTTLVAAKQLGRKYIGIEINPEYCAIAEERLKQGELFNQI